MSYDAGLPSSYDSMQMPRGALSMDYVKTIPGIIRCAEIVDCMICLITSSVLTGESHHSGGQWLLFIATISITFVTILFIYEIYNVHQSLMNMLSTWALIVVCTLSCLTINWFICGILTAVHGSVHPSAGASAFFAFVGTGLFAVDSFFAFQTYRSPGGSSASPSSQPFPPPTLNREPTSGPPPLSQAGYQSFPGGYSQPTTATNPGPVSPEQQ